MMKPSTKSQPQSRSVRVLLLFICWCCMVSRVSAIGIPEMPFTLTVEAIAKDPKLCRVVVTADKSQYWNSLKQANDEQLQRVLFFKLHKQSKQKIPAMLGRYRIKENRLEFQSAFPLVRGTRYQATFDPKPLDLPANMKQKTLQAKYYIPLPDAKPPRVLSIYPSGKKLPANHLKFYVQFSEPMQQGEIFEYFSLFNKTQNKQVPRPFRHTELWSPDGKQLTLWFHPGRQKVGVNLNVELGAILNEGDEYELKISKKWPALSGHTLGMPVSKVFSVVAMDERQPVMEDWKLSVPEPGTRKPLVCHLGEPLDYASLHSQLKVQNEAGVTLAGKIQLSQHESVWKWTPEELWKPGRYRLVVRTILEDLGGNSLQRPFAIDLTKENSTSTPLSAIGEFLWLDFQVKEEP